MTYNFREHWNKQLAKQPDYDHPSNYAIDKEKLFPRNSKVCDLGGGYGTDSLYFAEKGHKVYLFDIADLSLEKAMAKTKERGLEKHLTTKFVDLDKEKIPADDDFFDIVYSRLSIHYFSRDRTIEVLREIYRVLKLRGTAYIVIKSPEDKDELTWLESHGKKIEEGMYEENGFIKTRYTKAQYKLMLEKAGIKNFEIGDYTEKFGDEKVFLKSKADSLLYIEIVIIKE